MQRQVTKHCILFYLTNSVDPDEMQSRECSICCISSWFSLFAKVYIRGFPEYKGLIDAINGFFSDHIKLIAPCHKKTLVSAYFIEIFT